MVDWDSRAGTAEPTEREEIELSKEIIEEGKDHLTRKFDEKEIEHLTEFETQENTLNLYQEYIDQAWEKAEKVYLAKINKGSPELIAAGYKNEDAWLKESMSNENNPDLEKYGVIEEDLDEEVRRQLRSPKFEFDRKPLEEYDLMMEVVDEKIAENDTKYSNLGKESEFEGQLLYPGREIKDPDYL